MSMASTFFTDSDLRAQLRRLVAAVGSQRAFATTHGINHAYVARVLTGERPVGKRLAAILGYRMHGGHVYLGVEGTMENGLRQGYKILTHDYRSPLQRDEPIWDGITLAYTLPPVVLDTSEAECGAGWNYCASIAEAIPLCGLWPTGRPSTVFAVEASADAVQRGNKRRASRLTLLRQCPESEVVSAIRGFSGIFGAHQERLTEEQCAWRQALARPLRHEATVVEGLTTALEARALPWTLRRYETPRDVWAAWAAWDAWDARDARGAWDARGALQTTFAALQGWVLCDPSRHSAGIREAYRAGLELAVPVGSNILGWTMEGTG